MKDVRKRTGRNTHPYLVITTARREKSPIGATAHAPDGEVVENGVIDKHAGASVVNVPETRAYERGGLMGTGEGKEASTHHVLSPVVVSYICAERRQPVARYCSSAEKRTDPTLLEGAGLVRNC
jgi:hypothetical protein